MLLLPPLARGGWGGLKSYITMTKLYNRTSEKFKRQKLRTEMTEAEKRLGEHIRNRQLENCKFRRQYSVAAFVLDFYAPEIKLALEVDGDSHFVDGAVEYDAERQEFIESGRIKFLRFTNDDVYHNLDGVLEVIVEVIKSLRTSGVLPPPAPPSFGGGVRVSPLLRVRVKVSLIQNPKSSGLFVCDDNGIFPAQFSGSRPVFGGFAK